MDLDIKVIVFYRFVKGAYVTPSFYKAKTCLRINWIPKTLKTMGQTFKACFYKTKELNSQRIVVYTTNMAAVSSC